jgi:RimJ/RimL family protein N-acetyltransferase
MRDGPLPPGQYQRLAAALGDTPETVIAVHRLRHGWCRAWIAGELPHFAAAVVHEQFCPSEPAGFGLDAPALGRLLETVDGWDCVNVSQGVAPVLAERLQQASGAPVRTYEDIYHVLRTAAPVEQYARPEVRRLGPEDLSLLERAAPELSHIGYPTLCHLLEQGIVAAAVIGGEVVSVAQTYARTPRHADIGVHTLAPWRGRGFSTAAAALVARQAQREGQTPVWSAGRDNAASLRVAAKLGFQEVSRRLYLIPETPPPAE